MSQTFAFVMLLIALVMFVLSFLAVRHANKQVRETLEMLQKFKSEYEAAKEPK